jgi:hypothetical protein
MATKDLGQAMVASGMLELGATRVGHLVVSGYPRRHCQCIGRYWRVGSTHGS